MFRLNSKNEEMKKKEREKKKRKRIKSEIIWIKKIKLFELRKSKLKIEIKVNK